MFQRVDKILARISAKIDLFLEGHEVSEVDRKILLKLAKSLDRFSDAILTITGGAS
ncbi:hypothetical protein [Sulfurimonas sp.]|uniref:hypothetical protein n=1 Tax=Sulfurimonas sp. TaxID=2022749 RepID=UPI0025F6C8DC|nr:hypothetical protein [Sulfurimonas sp.]MBW6489098.1 hypothetical protein [Sulfurimonas sp.]